VGEKTNGGGNYLTGSEFQGGFVEEEVSLVCRGRAQKEGKVQIGETL